MAINVYFVVMPVVTVNMEPSGVLQLCPGSNITFVCTNNQTGFIVWRSFEQDSPDGDSFIFFNQENTIDMVQLLSGSFAVVLISASPLISTATLTNNFGPQLNGTNLTCSSTTSKIPSPSNGDYALLILKGTRCIHSLFIMFFSVWVCVWEREGDGDGARERDEDGEREGQGDEDGESLQHTTANYSNRLHCSRRLLYTPMQVIIIVM